MNFVVVTDLQVALYGLNNLKSCRFYCRDGGNRLTYVYDRLLGYDETSLVKDEKE